MNAPSENSKLDRRLIHLEELFAHHEKLVEQLNEVVTGMQASVQRIESRQATMEARLKWIVENALPSNDDPNEKPPHY